MNEVVDGLCFQQVHLFILNGSSCELSSFGRGKPQFGQFFENSKNDSFGAVKM